MGVYRQITCDGNSSEKLDRKTAAQNNLKLAREARSAMARFRHAQIIKYVVLGNTKQDIVRELGVSRGTVNNALNGLTEESVGGILLEFKDTVFGEVSSEALDMFVKCKFRYKEYRSCLDNNHIKGEMQSQVSEEAISSIKGVSKEGKLHVPVRNKETIKYNPRKYKGVQNTDFTGSDVSLEELGKISKCLADFVFRRYMDNKPYTTDDIIAYIVKEKGEEYVTDGVRKYIEEHYGKKTH